MPLDGEHRVRSPLELIGHRHDLDGVPLGEEAVHEPRQKRHGVTGALDHQREDTHRWRDTKQLVDRTVMPLLVEDIRPGEQQMRTQREVEGVVGEGQMWQRPSGIRLGMRLQVRGEERQGLAPQAVPAPAGAVPGPDEAGLVVCSRLSRPGWSRRTPGSRR